MIACMNFKVLFLSTPFLSVETIKCVTDSSNLSLSRKPELSFNVVVSTCWNAFNTSLSIGATAEEEEEVEDDDGRASEDEREAVRAPQSSLCEAEKYVRNFSSFAKSVISSDV